MSEGLTLVIVRAEGAAVQTALQQITQLIGNAVPPPLYQVQVEPARIATPALQLDPPVKRRGGRPRKVTSDAPPPAPAAEPEEKPGKEKMRDVIARLIEERGPLTTSRLAQLMATSEQAVARSLGHAKGQFVLDDDDKWILA